MKLSLFLILTGLFTAFGVSAKPLPVPIFRQSTDYSCGPASLISILYYWGVYDGTEQGLFELLKTDPEVGTAPNELAKGAIHFGLQAELKTEVTFEDIKAALKKGEPVIVNFQAWPTEKPKSWKNQWDDGHYAVAIDLDDESIYLMDPVLGNSYGKIGREDFLERWHDVDGGNKKLQQAAIFISGKTPAKQYPLPFAQIE